MYCVQCEQTIRNQTGAGCTGSRGLCGKTAPVSDLQDALVCLLQSLSAWAQAARRHDIVLDHLDEFVPRALFATLTNVNFDATRITALCDQAEALRTELRARVEAVCQPQGQALPEVALADYTLGTGDAARLAALAAADLRRPLTSDSEDLLGLRLLCLYGLKGVAAYLEHARVLGRCEPPLFARFHDFMAFLASQPEDAAALFQCALDIGLLNYEVMRLLDAAQVERYGHPMPTQVNTRPRAGKAILVSGHDLADLEQILIQTADTGIQIYTHGELLPAHAYPAFRKYPHLAGNYGSAWQNQQPEFAAFPGAIVMTSNCIIDPARGSYTDRIFTRNVVGWPGACHLDGTDFSVVIDKSMSLPGFGADEAPAFVTTGFARDALMAAAPAVIEQVKAGAIRHFFLIGGCDGARPERNYFADLAHAVPQDSVILTLACGKYRFNHEDFGSINGIPRLIDIGQCNDAYSAIQLALALAEAFGCGVNDLPLSLVLSWFEQKAIVILLTLLALGVKDIRVGPTPPAFLTPALIATLNAEFGLRLTGEVTSDLAEMLAA